jgi:hypothetical protein
MIKEINGHKFILLNQTKSYSFIDNSISINNYLWKCNNCKLKIETNDIDGEYYLEILRNHGSYYEIITNINSLISCNDYIIKNIIL